MQYTDRQYWLWLTLAFGPANPRKWNALSHYGSVAEAYERITSSDASKILPQDAKTVSAANMELVIKLEELCAEKGISICCYGDADYPQRLKEIYNPPSVLFYSGDISGIDDSIVITAVGTKTPSEYSVDVSRRIITDLAANGVRIASGFTVGLDSVAHSAALKAGGITYAVLPCGLLCEYPKENLESRPIIAAHGALISEYFPGDNVTSLGFRARNRVLSGLGLGTLVLQAGSKSGALSTASFALSQGRDIFCIPPHELYNDSYAGVIGLIRDGATPVFDSGDILGEYTGIYRHKLQTKPLYKKQSKKPTGEKPHRIEPEAAKPEVELVEITEAPEAYALEGTKKQIYEYIREHGETHLDQLAVGIGDVYEIEAFLTELELDGLIRSLPGNRFSV